MLQCLGKIRAHLLYLALGAFLEQIHHMRASGVERALREVRSQTGVEREKLRKPAALQGTLQHEHKVSEGFRDAGQRHGLDLGQTQQAIQQRVLDVV